MGNLTAKQVKEISKPGRYGDGGGLYFYVAPTGTRSWVQRIQIGGKRTDKGLGGYPKVALPQARKVADANRVAIRAGENPFEVTAKISAPVLVTGPVDVPTFEYAINAVYEKHSAEWAESTAKRWVPRMEQACKDLLDRPVDEITTLELAAMLTPLRKAHPETGRKVRQGLLQTFRWVKAAKFRPDNPADEDLDELVASVKHTPQHRESLPYAEVAAALHKVRFGYALRVTSLAFDFLVLTAARTSEVRFMTWEEVDLDNAVWELSAERMKARKGHRVPLSTQAVAILRAVQWQPDPKAADDDIHQLIEVKSGYVFRMPTGKRLSENALLDRCRKDKLDCTPHGFRTSFRTWGAENEIETYDVLEMCLAHYPGNEVERAYQRSDQLARRRVVMQAWADYVLPNEAPF